jgi:two-component system nitrogen regulation response regulator GlnG
VLLRGESGSGKELVARAIHDASERRSGPYVSVNVAAIPATTAAAELFGHRKGAFTGASEAHAGWFGGAHEGTLFLDEIGETPDAVQPMLLRVLETGEVQPVGGQGAKRVDVRVVTATDADLAAAANAGRFRFPLVQRLGGQVIFVPPLRERLADFGILLAHFLERELTALGMSRPKPGEAQQPWLPTEIVVRALAYEWPGNVRELANFARELVLSSRGQPSLRLGRTFGALLPQLEEPRRDSKSTPVAEREPSSSEKQGVTDEQLVSTLRANRWQVGATARALGIAKNTLYQLMERCEGIRKARDLTREEILECRAAAGDDSVLMAERLEVSERGLKLRMRELGID